MSTRPCIYKHFSIINIGSVSAYVQGFRLSRSLASPHKDSLGSRFCTYTHAAFTVLRRFYITGFPAPLCTTHKVCTQILLQVPRVYHSATRAIFQWTNFVVPGRLELPPPEFSSGTLPTKLQDFPYWRKLLQAFLLNHSGILRFTIVDLYKFRESVFIILAKLCCLNLNYFVTPAGLEPATPTLKVSC